MIPRIDASALFDPAAPGHAAAREAARHGAAEAGFLTVHSTAIDRAEVEALLDAYRRFFALPMAEKAKSAMARTGSNRGWAGPGSEQVDPEANPDYKQVFDCGLELDAGDPVARLGLPAYAPNVWPDEPPDFAPTLKGYYTRACGVALDLLVAVLDAVGEDGAWFRDRFRRPMALLRGNYYPARPGWAGEKDFGIGAHTDYGCLTLLATDGAAGLEVRRRDGSWEAVSAPPGEFIVNFGEMLDFWTAGRIVATPHRVTGPAHERISAPLFFNPDHDANVAPPGSGRTIRAVDHLQKRFDETYLHLKARA